MNRARVRIGQAAKIFHIDVPTQYNILMVEAAVDALLHKAWFLVGYRLEYLGRFAWDIFMDDKRIGHVKVWESPPSVDLPDSPTLWNWFLLIVSAYLALC